MKNLMEPLPRIEEFVKNPSFSIKATPKRIKQSNDIFVRAMRGELGSESQKIGITTPSVHPMDRTVFSPIMLRAFLWKACEADVFKWKINVSDKEKMSSHIKEVAKYFGADLVGITYLHPAFVYEDTRDGKPTDLSYKYAIVMAKEMDYDSIATSPSWMDHVEVGKKYQEMAVLSIHLAKYIGQLGYPARASFAGNDTVLHIPMAIYAGLGELSRMDRLITKEYGPRVRLCTVTTDLPLEADHPVDLNVEHFCQLCKKCATNCPTNAIPFGEKTEINGVLKWKIDGEACYKFFKKNPMKWGDCIRCISVCPWNKPNTPFHRMIAKKVVKDKWTHRTMLFLDDLFYGKKPKRKEIPPSYNDFLMKEEDYWQMIKDMDVREKHLGV